MSHPIECIVEERGNGFPDVGAYVQDINGQLYQVESFIGPIHTGQPGEPNYIRATVTPTEWDDCEEGEEFSARVVLPTAEELEDDAACVAEIRAEQEADAMPDARGGLMERQAKPPAKRRGRPPAGASGRSTQVTAKLSDDERAACEMAAQREGKTLSEWARNTLLLRASASG